MSNTSSGPNMMSEVDALEYARLLIEKYKKFEENLRKDYDELIKVKESFPVRYFEKEEFEDLVLRASNAKFKAAVVARQLGGLASESKYEFEYMIANFKLYISDEALSEKFDKITEGLRDAYVNSKVDLKVLRQLTARVAILADSAEKLIRMFETDETNFRRLLAHDQRSSSFGI